MTQLDRAATAETTTLLPDAFRDNASDYGDFGSDAEEIELLDELLAQVAANDEERQASFVVTDIEDYEPPQGILLPKTIVGTRLRASQIEAEADIEVLRDFQAASDTRRSPSPTKEPAPLPVAAGPDNRSPLDRFRKPPKKALSVTDLVSPAWCELQYFYVLSKHGRKRRTPAMKQGSVVHKSLEDEVHTTVPVETTKIEDSWGLRFWNICQGLKTLRETGRTRELEIWGTIGGELVNGIIDELSYDCPNPKYEESLKAKGVPTVELPEYQTSITEYLLTEPGKDGSSTGETTGMENEKWIYLTDVKTRATPTLPTGSSIRPTIVQLHLYHHMLENFVQGNFSLEKLAQRYKLDVNETFSDSFLAQLGNLNQEIFSESSQGSMEEQVQAATVASSQDSMDILLQHNNLSTLWKYMMTQFKNTFLLDEMPAAERLSGSFPPPASQQSTSDLPLPPPQPTRLSPLLTASYMSSNYKHTLGTSSAKHLLGHKSFQFNSQFLHAYLSEALAWWRGQRDANGVRLEEAWKCRSCDFKNECAWILERDQQAFDEAMERKKMREVAGVAGDGKEKKSPSRSKV